MDVENHYKRDLQITHLARRIWQRLFDPILSDFERQILRWSNNDKLKPKSWDWRNPARVYLRRLFDKFAQMDDRESLHWTIHVFHSRHSEQQRAKFCFDAEESSRFTTKSEANR